MSKKQLIIDIPDIKVTQIYNTTNFLLKYNWGFHLLDNKVVENLEMQDIKIMQVCNTTNVLLKYNWHLNLLANKAIVNLGIQNIKNYWRHTAQVADTLNHFQHFLPIFAVFMIKACINYDQKMQLDKCWRFR